MLPEQIRDSEDTGILINRPNSPARNNTERKMKRATFQITGGSTAEG